jgi:hypothetical protein
MTTVLVLSGGRRALAKRRRHHRFFLSAVTYPTKISLESTITALRYAHSGRMNFRLERDSPEQG